MKFLLIGFSEQNANLLSFLIQQNHKNIQCDYIERQLSKDQIFELPDISAHPNSDALIINLDGVGMMSYQTRYKEMLQAFIATRPALLSTRMSIEAWEQNHQAAHLIYLQSPYSKESMLEALERLIAIRQGVSIAAPVTEAPSVTVSEPTTPNIQATGNLSSSGLDNSGISQDEFDQIASFAQTSTPQAPTTPEPAQPAVAPAPTQVTPSTESITSAESYRLPLTDNPIILAPNNPAQDVVAKSLQVYFPEMYHRPIIKEFAKLFYQSTPFVLITSRYQLLIDPDNNLAVSTNIARVLDYLAVAKNHDEFAHSISLEPLTPERYRTHMAELDAIGAKKHTLNTLLWQLYHAILPERPTAAHNLQDSLQIKVRFMPNFATLDNLPVYTQTVISSCLSLPKTLDELYSLFSDINHEQLNRICLLAILAKIVDLNVLATPRPKSQVVTTHALDGAEQLAAKNEGVNKAAQSGFFRRLLNKLSFTE